MPLLLSVLTGIFFGLQSILVKLALKKQNQIQVLKYLFLVAGIILLPLALSAIPSIQWIPFFSTFFISLFINIAAYLLLFSAIKISPISIVMPFIGFTPLFLTLTGFLILGEKTGLIQFSGILFILAGGFVLQLPDRRQSETGKLSFTLFNREEKGIFLALAASFLWSISASIEKIAVLSSAPEFYGAFIHLSLGMVFFAISKNKRFKKDMTNSGKLMFLLLIIGFVSAGLALSQLMAIKLTEVSTVIAFKRSGILISGLAGVLYFKEGHFLKIFLGTIAILSGTF